MQQPLTEQTQLARVTVVLVEDDDVVREQLVGILGREGIDVLATATTIQAGYETVLARRPDVAVLDNQLPDGLGVDLCRRLTTHAPGTTVVMHSGAMTSTDKLDALDAGAAAVIPKSIRADALLQAIRTHARAPRVPRRA